MSAALIAALLFLFVPLAALRVRPTSWWLAGAERALGSRAAPTVAGALVGLAVWYVLGSLAPLPGVHDEAAYVLQAKIFAAFHWTAPGRPLPEFFEQFHTLVTPVTAAKYPPAFSLALVPGIWLGAPGLMIVVLSGLAGGMLYALARRFGGLWVAPLATALWGAAPISASRAGYYSEVLTVAVWLGGWMALLRWRDGGGRRWLVALSMIAAFGALARPLTMVAYAIPTAAATIALVARRRAWGDLAVAALAGVAVLAIIPLWSARTTGDWRTTPLDVYTRAYLPYDRPGFTVDRTPPARSGATDMQQIYALYLAEHETHARSSVASIYGPRILEIARSAFGRLGWPVLSALMLVGLVGAGTELLVAAGAAVALVLLYGSYAHPATWTLYYVEAVPTLLVLAAMGAARLARATRWFAGRKSGVQPNGAARPLPGAGPLLVASAIATAFAVARTAADHDRLASWVGTQSVFAAAVRSLPARSVVFVRYAPDHDANASLVVNEPDLATARTWIVYDRGAENARLMALAPDRAPYRFDEAAHTLMPMTSADLAGR